MKRAFRASKWKGWEGGEGGEEGGRKGGGEGAGRQVGVQRGERARERERERGEGVKSGGGVVLGEVWAWGGGRGFGGKEGMRRKMKLTLNYFDVFSTEELLPFGNKGI